jgi:hypothetical protein
VSDETSPNNNARTIIVLVAAYVILIAFSFYGSYKFTVWGTTDSPKNFAAVVTVCLTAASAMMGLIVSFVSLHKNQRSAVELERLKSDLQTKVFSQKIWTDLRFEHEKMKASAEGSAYAKLWTSTDYAYLLLAKLETSSWKSDDKLLMDNALLESHAQLVYARSLEHQTLWEKVRQRARFIAEEAGKIGVDEQPALWQKNVAEFTVLCRRFKEIANSEVNRPPPTQETKP